MAQAAPSTSSAPVNLVDDNTIDESVFKTIWRDIVTIGKNLRSVLIPINWNFNNNNQDQALRNWDLWGPLIFMLWLAVTLSWGEKKASEVFSMVFAECAIGAVVLTVNTTLLGGELVFFQALCLLGYCLFPICIAAVVCAAVSNKIARTVALVVGITWAGFATVPFIGKAVPQGRKVLAVYPVMLMYVSIGWVALVKSR